MVQETETEKFSGLNFQKWTATRLFLQVHFYVGLRSKTYGGIYLWSFFVISILNNYIFTWGVIFLIFHTLNGWTRKRGKTGGSLNRKQAEKNSSSQINKFTTKYSIINQDSVFSFFLLSSKYLPPSLLSAPSLSTFTSISLIRRQVQLQFIPVAKAFKSFYFLHLLQYYAAY